jgi:hypothetical protein
VHLHAWQSLAQAAKVEPRASPSLLNGTDGLLEFTHHDSGFDLDLDTYDIGAVRAMLRTSRKLLEDRGFTVSRSFRAGGYLGTPKVLLAARAEGFTVDSSALPPEQLATLPADEQYFHDRVAQVWPRLDATTQPFYLDAKSTQILEMPIAAVADFSSAEQLQAVFDKAYARLQQQPGHDVFVVLALHYETAADFASEIADAIAKVRSRPEVARHLTFARLDQAALLARFAP